MNKDVYVYGKAATLAESTDAVKEKDGDVWVLSYNDIIYLQAETCIGNEELYYAIIWADLYDISYGGSNERYIYNPNQPDFIYWAGDHGDYNVENLLNGQVPDTTSYRDNNMYIHTRTKMRNVTWAHTQGEAHPEFCKKHRVSFSPIIALIPQLIDEDFKATYNDGPWCEGGL